MISSESRQEKKLAPPKHIESRHWEEWLASGVDPDIIALNVQSISDLEVNSYTREVERPVAELLNWRVTQGYRNYPNINGWWVSGIDPLNNYEPMTWGRFKPDSDTPILDREKGSYAKYLSPSGQPSRLVFLRVPHHIWQRVSDRSGIPIKGNNFWRWVAEENVPVVPCEGEKKAGCLLTLGYAAISAPGIDNFTVMSDEQGNRLIQALLRPDLKPFINPERQITILFDYDNRPKVVRRINQAIGRTYWALVKAGCDPKVARLPGPDKGVDDFVMAHGGELLEKVMSRSKGLSDDRAERYASLTFPIAQSLEQRYLGDLEIPEGEKFICIKSPKGTGKSTWLQKVVQAAQDSNYPLPVIPLTHRTQLGQALCDALGLPFVTELGESEEGKLRGFGLCTDSLHPDSQARFKAEYYDDCILILDEVEQIIQHLLFANTEINRHRSVVLRELMTLLSNILESERGKIIALDADLCDISIQFILGMASSRITPYIVQNTWKPSDEAWEVYRYEQNTPKEWLACLCDNIAYADGAILIATQAQKASSTWSTRNLEKLLGEKFPGKRILRADAETVADQSHPAYCFASHINEVIVNYDIILASPTIGTGVSIDVRGHIESVWGCFWGVSDTDSARQFLARVREGVPRHVWANRRAVRQVANGETSLYKLLKNQELLATSNLKQIRKACETFDPEVGFIQNPTALNTWGRIACIQNLDRTAYRERLFTKLADEGHIVTNSDGIAMEVPKELYEQLVKRREAESAKEDEAIAAAEDISPSKYEELKRKKSKTEAERFKEQKHTLQDKYRIPVDAALVKRDRDGWNAKIRLHYLLGVGKVFLPDREMRVMGAMTERSKELWIPTINRALISLQVQCLEFLGIPDLIRFDRLEQEYRATDRDLNDLLRNSRQYRENIKLILGITIPEKENSAIKILQLFLEKLGLKLECDRQEGGKGQRVRVYRLLPPTDGREEVFAQWLQRDALSRSKSEMHTSPKYIDRDNSGEVCAA